MSAERIPVRERLLELLPAFAALLLHAITLDRWLSVLPVLLAILAVVARGLVTSSGTGWMILCGALGTGLGALELLVPRMPLTGPLPPTVLSLVTGALVGFVAYTSMSRRALHGQMFPWMLVALSLSVPATIPVRAAFAAMAAATLVSAFSQARIGRAGAFGYAFFSGFFVLLTTASIGLAFVARAGNEWLTDQVYEWSRDLTLQNGVAFETMLHLAPHSSVDRSLRPLLELSGPPVERLRTGVLDDFDGWTWKTSAALERARFRPQEPEASRAISLLPLENLEPTLPTPAGTWKVEGIGSEAFAGGIWKAGGALGRTLTLRTAPGEQLPPELPPDERVLQLPAPLRRALEPFAREVVGDTSDARTQATRLERHFHRNFSYSLDTDLRGDGHPLEVLLRERRPAYCVYFASAMAAMLRTVGTPARVVTGFLVGEANPYTHRTLVRGRDAHAWVEVYVAAEGRWVPFDPTPSQAAERPSAAGYLWDALASAVRRSFAAIRADPVTWILDLVTSPWLVAPMLALGAWILWRRGVFRFRRGGARRAARIEVSDVYRRYLRVLERGASLKPAPAETDEELIVRLRRLRGDRAADAAEDFLQRYRAQRYRQGAVEAAAFAEPLRALEEALAA